MPDRTPHEHLEDLHTELVATTPADSAAKARLGQLAGDVRRTIDAGTGIGTGTDAGDGAGTSAAEAYRALRQRLADAAAGFQASHPELTAEIERVLDTLASHNL